MAGIADTDDIKRLSDKIDGLTNSISENHTELSVILAGMAVRVDVNTNEIKTLRAKTNIQDWIGSLATAIISIAISLNIKK